MTNMKQLPNAIRFALFAGVTAMFTAPVYAQTTDNEASSDQAATLDKVMVTGSRLTSPGLISVTPVTTLTAEDIQRQQIVTAEEFFRRLPAAVPAVGPATNNGTGGGATIDLRGLGPNRALVLIDGRRFVPFDLAGQVDTNSIPLGLIESVDLVTGGGSAVYGADAITGVVNFKLKNDFEGLEISTSRGQSKTGDTDRKRVDITMGGNFADGRGNVVMGIGYTDSAALFQGDREFGKVSLSSSTGNELGSPTSVPASIFGPNALGGVLTPEGTIDETQLGNFNFNPLNFFQTPLERFQVSALGNYEINEHAEVYTQMFYTRSDVGSTLAPSGTFFNDFMVPIGNPFIPEPARQQICADAGVATADCVAGNPTETLLTIGRRFVELGPRLNDFENKTLQFTVGARGDIMDGWSYDAYYTHGESDQLQNRGNWGSFSKVSQALRAVDTENCIDPSNGCVPLNVFGVEGTITPEMIAFFNLDALLTQSVQQDIGSASVSGDLGDTLKSPWSEYPIAVAAGAEYRRVEAQNKSDSASQINGEVLGTGAAAPDVRGDFDLREEFAEIQIPLANGLPFMNELSIEGGVRHTKFSVADGSDNYWSYKYGGAWSPVEGLRFRGEFQKATRAPNVGELFSPQITGLDNLAADPCQGTAINQAEANTPGTLSNLCRLSGVPVNRIGTLPPPAAGQVNILTGGNTELGPEIGKTLTLGMVFTPAFAPDLALSLDYYRIRVTGAVSSASVDDVLDQCFSPQFNPNKVLNDACATLGRNPNTGTFNGTGSLGIPLVLSNLGKIKTDGFDLSVRYGLNMDALGMDPKWGRLSWDLAVNHVLNSEFRPTPSADSRECTGFFSVSCGNIVYDYKANFRTTWSVGDFDLSATARYTSSLDEEPGGTVFFTPFRSIGAATYWDLGASWRALDNVRFSLSVDNVANKKPPVVGNTIGSTSVNSGNTFPNFYDTVGVFYTVGMTVTF